MIKLRRGVYVVYNGKEYTKSTKKSLKGIIRLISWDKDDLKNGFLCYETQSFMSKYGFSCEKEVPKSEITEAYEIRTHAKYRDEKLEIVGNRNGTTLLTLSTKYRLPYDSKEENFEIKKLISKGFHEGQGEKDGCWYEIFVDINDPELELIEERTELDIDKL